MFQFTQCIAEAANGLAAHRSGCDAPFHKGFVRARNCFLVIVARSDAAPGELATLGLRIFVKLPGAAPLQPHRLPPPFARKNLLRGPSPLELVRTNPSSR